MTLENLELESNRYGYITDTCCRVYIFSCMTFYIIAGTAAVHALRRQIFRSNVVGLDAPMHLSATVKFWGVRVPRKRLCRKAIKLQLQLRFRRKMLCNAVHDAFCSWIPTTENCIKTNFKKVLKAAKRAYCVLTSIPAVQKKHILALATPEMVHAKAAGCTVKNTCHLPTLKLHQRKFAGECGADEPNITIFIGIPVVIDAKWRELSTSSDLVFRFALFHTGIKQVTKPTVLSS